MLLCQIFFRRFETFTPPAQMPGREEGRRDSENEQEQGVCLVEAAVQEDQANKEITREDHPDHQDGLLWMKKTMTMWEEWCLEQKRKNNTRERTQEPSKKTVREGTPVPKREIARVRTQ